MYEKFASVYDYFVNWSERLSYEMPFILEQLSQLAKILTKSKCSMRLVELANMRLP